MKKLKKKLSSRSGETILEVLVSILIVTVITAALVQAIVVSNRINKRIREMGLDKSLEYSASDPYINSDGSKAVNKSITKITTSESNVLTGDAGVYVRSILWDNDSQKGIYYSFEGPRS